MNANDLHISLGQLIAVISSLCIIGMVLFGFVIKNFTDISNLRTAISIIQIKATTTDETASKIDEKLKAILENVTNMRIQVTSMANVAEALRDKK